MGEVRLEVLSWLTAAFNSGGEVTKALILEEDIDEGEKVKDLLSRLVVKYPKVGQLVFDVNAERLGEEVMIGLNGCLIQLVNGVETKLTSGDTLTIFPVFQGG